MLLTDFGTADGAVSAMKGVAYSVSQDLLISDLSHENPSIFAGAYRLYQTEQFWPKDTVFVAVVDPGVGTERLSVVLKTRTGHYFVGPNNGLLSLVAERDGIEGLRQIDERVNRRPGSDESHTFHGRDVFAYTGARLAAGVIRFDEVGPSLAPQTLISIPYRRAERVGDALKGIIPVLDVQFGNVWTNIPKAAVRRIAPRVGSSGAGAHLSRQSAHRRGGRALPAHLRRSAGRQTAGVRQQLVESRRGAQSGEAMRPPTRSNPARTGSSNSVRRTRPESGGDAASRRPHSASAGAKNTSTVISSSMS